MKKIVLTAILAGSAVFAFAGNVSVNLGGIGVSVGNGRNQCGCFHRFSILLLLPATGGRCTASGCLSASGLLLSGGTCLPACTAAGKTPASRGAAS